MQQEKINKKAAVFFWILTVLCMTVIFYFSAQTAVDSREQSGLLLRILSKIFGDNILTDFIVRKGAHTLEFAGLSLLFNSAWYFTKNKKCPLLSLGCSSLYAVTDEFHQLFVEGRACKPVDWAIDTFGAALGLVGFIIIFEVIKIIRRKK